MKVNKSPAIFFILSVLLPALCGILLFLLPQRTFSENENRYLATIKLPKASDFMDTSMQENLTNSANDQFVGRDVWIKLSTAIKRAAGFQDMGGIYLGKEGYYFERVLDSHLSQARYLNHLHYLEQFAQTYDTAVTFLPVPSKGSIIKDQLPKNAVLYNADGLYNQAHELLRHAFLLDIRSVFLKDTGHQLYFKTDHHWTMDAAYLAYTAWSSIHGNTPASFSQYMPKCVSEDFYGTLYSKAPDFSTQPDRFFLPTNIPEAEISIDEKHADSIYDWSRLESKDKYSVYFGGNFAKIDIHAKNSTNGKTLLIIKDSFANSFVPFLMPDYENIIMIDLRYYNQPLSLLVQKVHPDETVFLYEMSNFVQDANFFKILK